MVDVVDKLMSELRSACAKEQIVRSHHVIYAQEAIATLRTELEQVKRERDEARETGSFHYNSWLKERDLKLATVEALRATERLAGERVVTDAMIEAGLEYYAEGGCGGLADHERREVVEAIIEAALAGAKP